MGFLLSRRWVVFAVVVALLAYLTLLLGQWQFGRLEDRKQENRIVSTNLRAAPVPVEEVLSTDRQPPAEAAWQRVTARGTWDDEHTIVLKYQTREGGAGVDVVTPLVTEDGTAVLVDRGWLATDNSGRTRPDLPPATEGTVTVTGYVRQDATGGATQVQDLSTRAVSSQAAAEAVPHPLYRGFLDLAEESPEPEQQLALTELPDAGSNGPHFFYGLQWWFFGALAVFGFAYLAYDELRGRRREGTPAGEARRRPGRDSEPAQQTAVHGQHRPRDEG
ncbi:SURF1 family protein [Nocardioides aurantiacus]|uniref:SURF1-like protein n=1 Tax=Nocardioides aurantiacus TaxID=86796 RepID=A0A3N2CSZ1_9ACTN|nr:SURF1 family protein [Nocardioides aurantiacus]ROR90662.1 cytochrome oxidase assembly protein ShyY1 [Nocardioides aurantiacus]